MKKKAIVAVVVVAVVVFVVWWFVSGPFVPNAPHVNLNITNGSGYSNTLNGSPNYHYECTVTNSGTLTARNVRFAVKFFSANHVLIRVEESASVGDIAAGATQNVSINVPYPTQPVYSTEVTPLYEG